MQGVPQPQPVSLKFRDIAVDVPLAMEAKEMLLYHLDSADKWRRIQSTEVLLFLLLVRVLVNLQWEGRAVAKDMAVYSEEIFLLLVRSHIVHPQNSRNFHKQPYSSFLMHVSKDH